MIGSNKGRDRLNRRIDWLAKWLITGGGVAVIAAMLAMLVLIVGETAPLFMSASARMTGETALPNGVRTDDIAVMGVASDLHREKAVAVAITREGRVGFFASNGKQSGFVDLRPGDGKRPEVKWVESIGGGKFGILWGDGLFTLYAMHLDSADVSDPEATYEELFSERLDHDPLFVMFRGDAKEYNLVAVDASGTIREKSLRPKKGLAAKGKGVEGTRESTIPYEGEIASVALDSGGGMLYLGTTDGEIISAELPRDMKASVDFEITPAFRDYRSITGISFLHGDYAIAVGDELGGTGVWFPVREGNAFKLRQADKWESGGGKIVSVSPSRRDRGFLTLNSGGDIRWLYSTNGRELLTLPAGRQKVAAFAVNDRTDSMVTLAEDGTMAFLNIDGQYPEAGWVGFFGKILYEGYEKPDYVWQSSGGDAAEAKLSLVPVVWGSLKGAFYALLFATPLALGAAMYLSQFADRRWRAKLKPLIEMTAAVPSVVIGFIAALWFAPILERNLLALPVFLVLVPVIGVAFVLFGGGLARIKLIREKGDAYAFLALVAPLVGTFATAVLFARWIEARFLGGPFTQWMATQAGGMELFRYDQRNSLVIAFAMGFAVIPTIFSLAEDAISAVPPSLSAASLALGASKWQTVWRVVMPSASPGVFTAVMLGMGRAVGETMIVLMAAGNTPLLSLSPFNGMRTLSANIAVEMPEAPVGGTLYRTLFLCALALFLLTMVVNTCAELVRQRLRRRYGRL